MLLDKSALLDFLAVLDEEASKEIQVWWNCHDGQTCAAAGEHLKLTLNL